MRVVIFTDANNQATTALLRATLQLAAERCDVDVCAIVTSRPDAFRSNRRRDAVRWVRRLVVAATNAGSSALFPRRTRIDLFRVARARRIPVLVPPKGNPNDPAFVARLRDVRPDVALSYYCTRIWKTDLLHAFPQAVNYHDGLLPAYKGVAATSFSIFHGEPTTGFTFHRMDDGIDTGPILVQGTVAIREHNVFAEVDARKIAAATAALPRVLDLIATDDPGRPQTDSGGYHSVRDLQAVTRIERPDLLTMTDLRRRIRAFGAVRLTIDGTEWPVTRLRSGRPGRRLTIRTADGSYATVDRIRGLPVRFARRSTRLR